MTLEITAHGGRNMSVKVSPLHEVTRFLELAPDLDAGEFIRPNTSTAPKLKHASDALAHDDGKLVALAWWLCSR